ncbi:MAG TPA: dTMP kinase [Acetobacteraceae bacterium]|jgi:dTMP kinase|nr:dTMP kinase [Acetobacteraceae bacterium]
MTRGRFITFEGGEGAGKSTQARMLADALADLGVAVLRTREPGGAPGAEVLRDLLLSGAVAWSAPAEALLHFAARAEHVEQSIRPALAAGIWVVCDRFADSTMAYQGYGQGADRTMIATLTSLIGLVPDVTIVLDVSDAVALGRLKSRGGASDRYERLDAAFHARVNEGFRAIAGAAPERCVVVPADDSEAGVHAAVMRAVWERLPPVVRGLA